MQVCARHSATRKLGIRQLGQLRIEGRRHPAPTIRGKAGAELCPQDIRDVTGSLPRPADRGFRNTVHSLAHDGSSLVEKSKSAMPCLRTRRVTRVGDGIRHLNVTQVEDTGQWKVSIDQAADASPGWFPTADGEDPGAAMGEVASVHG